MPSYNCMQQGTINSGNQCVFNSKNTKSFPGAAINAKYLTDVRCDGGDVIMANGGGQYFVLDQDAVARENLIVDYPN
jgi:hypothetical protein